MFISEALTPIKRFSRVPVYQLSAGSLRDGKLSIAHNFHPIIRIEYPDGAPTFFYDRRDGRLMRYDRKAFVTILRIKRPRRQTNQAGNYTKLRQKNPRRARIHCDPGEAGITCERIILMSDTAIHVLKSGEISILPHLDTPIVDSVKLGRFR